MPGGRDIAYDPSSALIATKSFEVADRNRTGVLVHGVESQIPISQLFHKTWPLTHPACVTISPSRCDNDNCQQEPVGQRRLHNPYNGKPDLNPDCRQRAFEGEGGKGILARHVTYDCLLPMIGKVRDEEGLRPGIGGTFCLASARSHRCAVVGMREGKSRRDWSHSPWRTLNQTWQ